MMNKYKLWSALFMVGFCCFLIGGYTSVVVHSTTKEIPVWAWVLAVFGGLFFLLIAIKISKKKQQHEMPEVGGKVWVQAGMQVIKAKYKGDGWFDAKVKTDKGKKVIPVHTVSLVAWNYRKQK